MQFLTSALAASVLATTVLAHPGHDHSHEIEERAAFTKFSKKDLSHCAEKFKARGIEQRSIARRAATAEKARQKRGISLDAPYLRTRADTTEHESAIAYTSDTAASVLFASNSSCILSPEVTQGPYWVEGEYVREDLTEDQAGVEVILDAQVVDITTCEPVTNSMIEIWACNSTGVYSGIVASGNGDSGDLTNLNNTFLRGLQPTNSDGVAEFTTLFPGHYTGRATHIHVLVHFNGTQSPNGTYSGGYVSHVGQLFFDQDLITEVEATSAYSANTQDLTTNAADSIYASETANGHDPIVEYSLLGSSVTDGIFAWISFGVDLTSAQVISGAATLTSAGGVANANSGMGGGGGSGGPGGNGTAPGGTPPPGSMPSGISNGTFTNSTTSSSSSVAATVSSTFVPSVASSSSSVISTGFVILLMVLRLF